MYTEESETTIIKCKDFKDYQIILSPAPGQYITKENLTLYSKNFSNTSKIAAKNKEIDSEADSELSLNKIQLPLNRNPKEIIAEESSVNSSYIVESFDTLSSFFNHKVTFKLLYRASNHNFRVADFHQICDSYQDTLTLCLTEDLKIIGGFTPLTWDEQFEKNSTYFKSDFKNETFLFSVSDNVKYPLARAIRNKAICCFKAYGPTFGGGYDLRIGDRTNECSNTTSYFPRNFTHPKGANFNKRDFTGTSRKNFKLCQWQVFSVVKVSDLNTMENINFESQIARTQCINGRKSCFECLKACAKLLYSKFCQHG